MRTQRTPRASPTKFPSNSASKEPQDTQRETSPHKPSTFQTISSKLTSDPSQPSDEIGPGSRVVRLAPFADPESPERGQEGNTGESPPEHLKPSRGCGSPSAGHRAPPGNAGLCAPRLWPAPPRPPPPPPRTSSASSRSSPCALRPLPPAPPNLPAPLAPGARAPHWTDRGRSAPQPIAGCAGGGAHGPGPPMARRLLTNSPPNERRAVRAAALAGRHPRLHGTGDWVLRLSESRGLSGLRRPRLTPSACPFLASTEGSSSRRAVPYQRAWATWRQSADPQGYPQTAKLPTC